MDVANLRWENTGSAVRGNIEAHKDAKIKDKTLSAKLLGDVTIRVIGGKALDRKKGFVLITLPHITSRSSYIVSGHELQTVNQLRLRPGPYTRFTADDNTETFVNAAGGGYRVIFNRETKVLRLRSGSTYVYLYPIMKSLGVDDREMADAWGSEIVTANKKHDKPEQLGRLYKAMRPYSEVPTGQGELATAVDSFFRSKALDPKISQLTLRESFNQITPRLLLKSAAKAIDLAGGAVEPDDTESLAFKSIHSVEDFIPEKLTKAIPGIIIGIRRKMDRIPKISSLMSPASFSDPIINWFLTSEFNRYSEQQNPIDIISTNQLTTTMGEGGIKSTHAVTDQLRVVHPSQMGFLDPMHTPEGGKIGVTGHLTIGARKVGNSLFTSVVEAKTGKSVSKSAQDLEDAVVAFYDQYDFSKRPPVPITPMVKARKTGEIQLVPARDVDYIFHESKTLFSATTNTVPFLNSNHANRVLMADRHIEQAVPLIEPDKPLVQARFKGNMGYEDFLGMASNRVSPAPGRVMKVTKTNITIKDTKGRLHVIPLHFNYPLNGGAFLTDTATVKIGDLVKQGDLIAENNFTKDGSLAIGKNLKVAFIPYKGYNFEDGVVISENAAQKLTSEHKHEFRLDITPNTVVGLKRWLAHYPDEGPSVDRSKYDASGVIKKGAEIMRDEVLIPAVERVTPHEEYDYDKLHKSLRQPWRNAAIRWGSDFPGKVVDVVKTAKFIKVFIKTKESMQIGDKISNRHGAKGIVVTILPDNEMYKDEDGDTIDVLFNPAGIPGRVNPGHLLEAATGKIALKTGKPYLADNFDTSKSVLDRVEADLKKAKVNDEESIYDPVGNKYIPDVTVGNVHFMKLQHQVRKKFKAKSIGGYTTDEQPAKISGSERSSQSIGSGELFSLLASGSTHFLRDATTLKSQSNPDFWRAMQTGRPLPPPKQPYILDKFINYMEGAGINLKRDGTMLKALPMTDTEVALRSKGEVMSPHVVRASDLKPEEGGLFDKGITGGYDGINWTHIDLETPVPNPLTERALISVAGLKPAQFKGIMNGSIFVKPNGQLTTDGDEGLPTGDGLKILLDKVDVKKDLKDTIKEVRVAKGVKLDLLNKRRRYLQALKDSKLSPSEAYIQSKMAIIPPKFRPIYPLPDGSLNVADPNHGYREILMVNNQLKDLRKQGVDNKNMASIRADLYAAVQGMTGMAEPLTRSKNFKGFVATIKGRQNKYGLFQGKVVKRPQDLSARSTIIPDPNLGIDNVGIPEAMAMQIYKPFVVKRMVNLGITPNDALDKIDSDDPIAKSALKAEMEERPVYLNRAPSLHKFSMLPFKPIAIGGRAIMINPLIVRGFNADFDGDTMGVHVPVSEEARIEAFTKLPSIQLFSSREDSIMHAPTKETVLGIYLMTKPTGKRAMASSVQEMLAKFQRKEIAVNQPVIIRGQTWTPGQALVDDVFPEGFKPGNVVISNKVLQKLLFEVSRAHPKKAGQIITKIKDLGNHYVTDIGFSVGLKDLRIDYKERDRILAKAAVHAKRLGFARAYGEANKELQAMVAKQKTNRFVIGSIISGAFGKGGQVTQMIAAPVAVEDHKGKIIPVPIGRSFAEGHDVASYWATIPGARKGLADKGLKTADTGALSKKLINTTIEERISMKDCGTIRGIEMPVVSREALDRVVANGPGKGRLADPLLVRSLKGRGVKTILVRSPLTCQAQRGTCALCFGLLENGAYPPIGYHVGVLAGQSISEPLTQLTLRAFHTGGAIGRKKVGFERIKQIMEMPENVPGRAVIAQSPGVITSVKKSAGGGWLVNVGDTEHFVPLERGLAIKMGQRIKAGQKISETGVIKPQELLAATGDISRVRNQLINDMENEFSGGGVRIKRKLLETVVKPMTNRAEVVDAGDGEQFHIYRGDVVSVNKLEELNQKIKATRGRPIRYNPTLLSIRVSPYHSGDFIGKLMFERPHETIAAAPAIGATADIRSGHPITQYAFGRYFGQKDK